jgi:hypothetical protein
VLPVRHQPPIAARGAGSYPVLVHIPTAHVGYYSEKRCSACKRALVLYRANPYRSRTGTAAFLVVADCSGGSLATQG